jgi:hypothetical protein
MERVKCFTCLPELPCTQHSRIHVSEPAFYRGDYQGINLSGDSKGFYMSFDKQPDGSFKCVEYAEWGNHD